MNVHQAASIVANGGSVEFNDGVWGCETATDQAIVDHYDLEDLDKPRRIPDYGNTVRTVYRSGEKLFSMVAHDENFGAIWHAAIVAAMETR